MLVKSYVLLVATPMPGALDITNRLEVVSSESTEKPTLPLCVAKLAEVTSWPAGELQAKLGSGEFVQNSKEIEPILLVEGTTN